MVKLLLEKGADPYAESKFFGTPLAAAAFKYDIDPEAFQTLLDVSHDAVHKPKEVPTMIKILARMTALFGVAGNVKFCGMNRMMKGVKSVKGQTPIHLAAARGDVEMVKKMLAACPAPPALAASAKVQTPDAIAEKKFAPHLVTVDAIKTVLNNAQPPANAPAGSTGLFDSTQFVQTV